MRHEKARNKRVRSDLDQLRARPKPAKLGAGENDARELMRMVESRVCGSAGGAGIAYLLDRGAGLWLTRRGRERSRGEDER